MLTVRVQSYTLYGYNSWSGTVKPEYSTQQYRKQRDIGILIGALIVMGLAIMLTVVCG
jgi:hypothetical protein